MGKSTFSKMKIFDFFKNENFQFFQKKTFSRKNIGYIFQKSLVVRWENYSETRRRPDPGLRIWEFVNPAPSWPGLAFSQCFILLKYWFAMLLFLEDHSPGISKVLLWQMWSRAVVVRRLQMGFRGEPLVGSLAILLNVEFRQTGTSTESHA